ncbi:PKD-like family lipoprotein [Bacteroides caecimuris]|uniref:PKD-like family lipoprotein n=1 Tax=Bacteroides caecimuris TaxID=1796613 RepID=UPI00263B1A2C|nr:PKD-like family lipoprotein [Bacteroides caecimuris]
MKKYIFISPLLLCLLSLYSCYDDSSTLATNNIGNITFTEKQSELYIGSMEELTLIPDIQIAEGTNTDALTYEWALTETPVTSSSSYNFEYEIISTDPQLNYVVERPVSTSPYTLLLTITDTVHDNLQYTKSWKIHVQSTFLDGLLISDTENGTTSDLTLINNQAFTVNYNKDEQIFRNILTSINGQSFNGLMQTLVYEVMGYGSSIQTNQVWTILGDATLARFNCLDYTQNGQFQDQSLIIDKPNGLRVLSAFQSHSNFYINTSNNLYTLASSTVNRFSGPAGALSPYKVNNNVIAYSPNNGYVSNSLSGADQQHLTFYDKEQAAFITCNGSGQFMQIKSFDANNNFDPNKLPNQTAISAVVFEDMSQIVFLMKDDTNGTYSIYTFSRYIGEESRYDGDDWIVTSPSQPASARNKYTIPSEGTTLLDKAISIFFSNRNLLLYVTTTDGIYTINYGAGTTATVSTTPKYTPQSGEVITKAKMYQQGLYNYNCNLIVGDNPTVPQTEWNNKAIIVTTQSSEYEGKVHIIPITQVANGTLDASQAKTYDGFGKILDVTTTGY